MAATDWKKFSTRHSISGVCAPASTGGNASCISLPGTDKASDIRPPCFCWLRCLITEFIGQNNRSCIGSVALQTPMDDAYLTAADSRPHHPVAFFYPRKVKAGAHILVCFVLRPGSTRNPNPDRHNSAMPTTTSTTVLSGRVAPLSRVQGLSQRKNSALESFEECIVWGCCLAPARILGVKTIMARIAAISASGNYSIGLNLNVKTQDKSRG
jgi:hypothetical protein